MARVYPAVRVEITGALRGLESRRLVRLSAIIFPMNPAVKEATSLCLPEQPLSIVISRMITAALLSIASTLALAYPQVSTSSTGSIRIHENSTTKPSISPSNTTSSGNNLNIICSGEHFGFQPTISDCQSAREYIAPDYTQHSWGQRHTGLDSTTFPLPFRSMGGKFTIHGNFSLFLFLITC